MKRVSHPNMKPVQRKYRRESPAERWLADHLLLAGAKAELARVPLDHPMRAEMEAAVAEFEASLQPNAEAQP